MKVKVYLEIEKIVNGYIVEDANEEKRVFNKLNDLQNWLIPYLQEYFDEQVEPMPLVTRAQEDWKKLTNKIKSEKAAELEEKDFKSICGVYSD